MSLQSENTDKLFPTLESLRLDFLNWRRDPHSPSRIPEPLWDKVIQLLSLHSKSKVLSSLGISQAQLEKKLMVRQQLSVERMNLFNPQQEPNESTQNKNSFVKAIFEAPTQPSDFFDVILIKPNGAQLQIQKLSHASVLKLTEQFTG